MSRLEEVLADLADEGDQLDAMVAPLDERGWHRATPAVGWDVAHQIAHLAWTDEVAAHGLAAPGEQFRVELTAPDGEPWVYGDRAAAQTVRGSAYDFCLLVSRRRHRADLDVRADGPDADTWLDIAQAFAGPPGSGRPAGVR